MEKGRPALYDLFFISYIKVVTKVPFCRKTPKNIIKVNFFKFGTLGQRGTCGMIIQVTLSETFLDSMNLV